MIDHPQSHSPPTTPLAPGMPVEVRDRFEGHFARGFEISEATDHGYRVRRRSDGCELPAVFDFEEIRPS